MTVPNDAYTIEPLPQVKIYAEHIQKVFDDCHLMDITKNYTINSAKIIKTSDITDSIAYIQSLQLQVVVQ